MKWFFRFILALTRFELEIAKKTGRNPDNVGALAQDVVYYEGLLLREEIQNDYHNRH